ncbi:hypothetical protein BDR26DRAFT_1013427 [Obelidium mucronatum]|nr:hypothetical protein BDR26DRAFT_1013427 [Obelidium mucronatum]
MESFETNITGNIEIEEVPILLQKHQDKVTAAASNSKPGISEAPPGPDDSPKKRPLIIDLSNANLSEESAIPQHPPTASAAEESKAEAISGTATSTYEHLTKDEPKFKFTWLENAKLSGLNDKDVQALLFKWGMQDHCYLKRFGFDRKLNAYEIDEFILDLFNNGNVNAHLKVLGTKDRWGTLGRVSRVEKEETLHSVTSLTFFDRLSTTAEVVRPDGSIKKCIDEYVGSFVVADELRKCLLMPEAESYPTFSETDRQEFVFHVFKAMCLGGKLCQYEDDIEPYLTVTKKVYKDLISVAKDSSGKLQVSSLVYKIKSVESSCIALCFQWSIPKTFATSALMHQRDLSMCFTMPAMSSSAKPLSGVGSLILENAADDTKSDCTLSEDASLVKWAADLTANAHTSPNEFVALRCVASVTHADSPRSADLSLVLHRVLPRFAAAASPVFALQCAALLRRVLFEHGAARFRDFFGASDEDGRRSSHAVKGLASARPQDFFALFRELWLVDCQQKPETVACNLLVLDWMVSLLEADLRVHLDSDRFSYSMLYEFMNNTNLTQFLRNQHYRILDTVLEMVFFKNSASPETASSENSKSLHMFATKSRDLGFRLWNLLILFCQEAPSANSDRIGFETLDDEMWMRLQSFTCTDRVVFYRGITSPEFRSLIIHSDLNNASNWVPEVDIPYNFPYLDSVPLLHLLYMLVVDNGHGRNLNDAALADKVDAVSKLESRVGDWVGGDVLLQDRLMAPLKIWALC